MVMRPTGTIIAPPMPWSTRQATSMLMSTATAHSSEPRLNSAIAEAKTRRVPKRSAIQPLIGMKTARLSV